MLRRTTQARSRHATIRAEMKEFCPPCFRIPYGAIVGGALAILDAVAVVATLWRL